MGAEDPDETGRIGRHDHLAAGSTAVARSLPAAVGENNASGVAVELIEAIDSVAWRTIPAILTVVSPSVRVSASPRGLVR